MTLFLLSNGISKQKIWLLYNSLILHFLIHLLKM